MKTIIIISAIGIVLPLSFINLAGETIQKVSALSAFIHIANIPVKGALVTLSAENYTLKQYHRIYDTHLNGGMSNIELPLPHSYQSGDLMRVTVLETRPTVYINSSRIAPIGNEGVDTWFSLP